MQLVRQAARAGWAEFDLPPSNALDALSTVASYESLRSLLPENRDKDTQQLDSLTSLSGQVDAFILDGYGVIHVGEDMVPGFSDFLSKAYAAHIPVIILTNGASHESSSRAKKYQSWGLDIQPEQIVSSRDAFIHLIKQDAHQEGQQRILLSLDRQTTSLGLDGEIRFDGSKDSLMQADAFVMLGATGWDDTQNKMLVEALQARPRPLYIANPDISAPQISGFSNEPGYWALQIMQQTGQLPIWAGKPHPTAYELALGRLKALTGSIPAYDRIAMVGDSLHTDILGANHMGLRSVLLTGYGLLNGLDWQALTDITGIYPDFQTARL